MDSSTNTTLSWSALEFEKKDRHPDWLWYVGLVFGLAAVISFFYGNIFFGIFLVVAGIVMIVYAVKDPKLLTVTLTKKNIEISDGVMPHSNIPYEKIKGFALDETGKPDKLLLQVKGSFVPIISLPLGGVTADSVKKFLIGKVPEAELRESTSVKIFDRFGF